MALLSHNNMFQSESRCFTLKQRTVEADFHTHGRTPEPGTGAPHTSGRQRRRGAQRASPEAARRLLALSVPAQV